MSDERAEELCVLTDVGDVFGEGIEGKVAGYIYCLPYSESTASSLLDT